MADEFPHADQGRTGNQPDPFIDVLLVVLIFLMLTTTYAKFTEMKINLPNANAQSASPRPKELVVWYRQTAATSSTNGSWKPVGGAWHAALNAAAGSAKDTVIVVTADAWPPTKASST